MRRLSIEILKVRIKCESGGVRVGFEEMFTFGTDAHLVLGSSFEEALDTTAWELEKVMLVLLFWMDERLGNWR